MRFKKIHKMTKKTVTLNKVLEKTLNSNTIIRCSSIILAFLIFALWKWGSVMYTLFIAYHSPSIKGGKLGRLSLSIPKRSHILLLNTYSCWYCPLQGLYNDLVKMSKLKSNVERRHSQSNFIPNLPTFLVQVLCAIEVFVVTQRLEIGNSVHLLCQILQHYRTLSYQWKHCHRYHIPEGRIQC